MYRRIDQYLYQEEKSLRLRCLLFPLYLLSLLYRMAVRVRTRAYEVSLLKSRHLSCPVVSVGNITVGGTGKTPLVMMLAKGLMDRGIPTAILSRGYRRKGGSNPLVTDGQRVFLSEQEAGDEPFQMAHALKGIPILVGKDRYANGQLALQRFNIRGLLLDDGYQYLRLHRDLDILLIDSQVGFSDRHLLPRGILREPVEEVRRAHLLLLTKVEEAETCRPFERFLAKIHPSPLIFHSHYEPKEVIRPFGERTQSVEILKGKKALAVSGIATPSYFSSLLRKCGTEVVGEMIFPDHHRFSKEDLAHIEKRSRGIDWIVTTEKDMARLRTLPIADLPLLALRIEMKIWEEKDFYRKVLEVF